MVGKLTDEDSFQVWPSWGLGFPLGKEPTYWGKNGHGILEWGQREPRELGKRVRAPWAPKAFLSNSAFPGARGAQERTRLAFPPKGNPKGGPLGRTLTRLSQEAGVKGVPWGPEGNLAPVGGTPKGIPGPKGGLVGAPIYFSFWDRICFPRGLIPGRPFFPKQKGAEKSLGVHLDFGLWIPRGLGGNPQFYWKDSGSGPLSPKTRGRAR